MNTSQQLVAFLQKKVSALQQNQFLDLKNALPLQIGCESLHCPDSEHISWLELEPVNV